MMLLAFSFVPLTEISSKMYFCTYYLQENATKHSQAVKNDEISTISGHNIFRKGVIFTVKMHHRGSKKYLIRYILSKFYTVYENRKKSL